MRYRPIQGPTWYGFGAIFARMLKGAPPQNQTELLAREMLQLGGYLPVARFISHHRQQIADGKSIPVLIDIGGKSFMWIGADTATGKIGIGWTVFDAPLLLEYESVDLGFTSRPPRTFDSWNLLYRWVRKKINTIRPRLVASKFCMC